MKFKYLLLGVAEMEYLMSNNTASIIQSQDSLCKDIIRTIKVG